MTLLQKFLAFAFADVIFGCICFTVIGWLEMGLFWILSSNTALEFYARSAAYIVLTCIYIPILAKVIRDAWKFPKEVWHGERD